MHTKAVEAFIFDGFGVPGTFIPDMVFFITLGVNQFFLHGCRFEFYWSTYVLLYPAEQSP